MSGSKFTNNVKGGLAPKVLLQVCDFIHAHFHRQIFLSVLACIAQISEYHFCRMFKDKMALTAQQYITRVRVEQVKQLCSTTELSLSEIALRCGFSNQSHMGPYVKQSMGASPKQFRLQI